MSACKPTLTVILVLPNYDDGRKAQRTEGCVSFDTVELAVGHTSRRSETLLGGLYKIGTDDL